MLAFKRARPAIFKMAYLYRICGLTTPQSLFCLFQKAIELCIAFNIISSYISEMLEAFKAFFNFMFFICMILVKAVHVSLQYITFHYILNQKS